MQPNYLQKLVIEIKNHSIIRQNETLAKEVWSKKSFKECSKVIGDTLLSNFSMDDVMSYGTTISYKTLETIFKQRYNLKYPLDRRCLITLTKLVRFIGYPSWSEFMEHVDASNMQSKQFSQSIELANKMAS